MSNQNTAHATQATDRTRYWLVAALVIASFFGAYRYAAAGSAGAAPLGAAGAATAGAQSGGAAGGGGGCCGGGAGSQTTGAATVEGNVQKISVDASQGFNPGTIQLKAGIPAEITFSQGGGCTAGVVSQDLGFQEDLTSGPKTVKLDALQPGTYSFTCAMGMIQGSIVVQ